MPTERFSVVSSRSFADVVKSSEDAVGHPKLGELMTSMSAAKSYDELAAIVGKVVGPTDLMEFLRFDMGGVIGTGKPAPQPKSIRFLIGNPVTMRKMAEHVADAAAYAPITVLVDERRDGVHLSYDRIGGSLAPYGNAAASAVASELDRNVETILVAAAGSD
ncbi:MAG: hypothetical protein JWM53_4556 [bacterium]|nr:hypothetical protein [bacterium]